MPDEQWGYWDKCCSYFPYEAKIPAEIGRVEILNCSNRGICSKVEHPRKKSVIYCMDIMEEETIEFALPMKYLREEEYIRNSTRLFKLSICAQQAPFFLLAKTVPALAWNLGKRPGLIVVRPIWARNSIGPKTFYYWKFCQLDLGPPSLPPSLFSAYVMSYTFNHWLYPDETQIIPLAPTFLLNSRLTEATLLCTSLLLWKVLEKSLKSSHISFWWVSL